MTEIDKNNKPKNKDGLKLPDEFYQDLGLEPQGLPDLSEAWSDIEARGAAPEALEELAYLSGTAAPVSEDAQDQDQAADQEITSDQEAITNQTDDLPEATEQESAAAGSQENSGSSKTSTKPAEPHNSKPQGQSTPPHKPEKYTKEASKAPSLRDKFRALRKYFIISVVLNLVLIAALVLLGIFYYKEINSGKHLEPREGQTTVASVDKDETTATGEEDRKQDAGTNKTDSSDEGKAVTSDKAKTEKTEDADKSKKDSSGAAAKTTESKSKKPAATSKAKETTEAKTTSAKETTASEASTAEVTTEAETSAKPVETTAAKATEESTSGSQETTAKETKAPAETSSKETKAAEAESPLDKALAKAKKLSQEELKEKALNLNYYEMSANPDQHVNDLVVAGGKILNIYDDGFLIVEDYLPGGLTYYYCPWFIRFDKAKDLGLSVGEVVNFYGIYTEMGTYREGGAEQALIVEGVDYVSVGW